MKALESVSSVSQTEDEDNESTIKKLLTIKKGLKNKVNIIAYTI